MKTTTTQILLCLLLLITLIVQNSPVGAQNVDMKTTSATIAKHARELNLTPSNLLNYRISDAYHDKASGATIVFLQQTSKGVDVFNAIKTVAIKNDKILSAAGSFNDDIESAAASYAGKRTIQAADAVRTALQHLSLSSPAAISAIMNTGGEINFGKLGVSSVDVKAKQLWIFDEQNTSAALHWQVEIQPLRKSDYWLVNVDAWKGAVTSKLNLTISCDWQHPVNAMAAAVTPPDTTAPVEEAVDTSILPEGGAYRVIAYPAESPVHPGGHPHFDVNPWNKSGMDNPAVTFKWYADSTGSFDSSRSNNVLAQEDVNGNNGFGIGAHSYFPAPHLLFQRKPDLTQDPKLEKNQQFAITNLFYWNNLMHDVTYQYGFDEVSGNFQNSNMGRGGKSNDYVLADAQDGSGTDNANFSTPSDGNKPRMQMFLWNTGSTLKVNSPAEFSGFKTALESAFSANNKLDDKGPITGEVILVNDDAAGTTHIACGPVFNASALAGKIALIDRGTCTFTEKVMIAQKAGAIAVIMINNVPGYPITMGGANDSIVIPAEMISLETGDSMKLYLATQPPVLVTMAPGIRIDGDLDNGIIAHEYGHGVSSRLTGGPRTVTCLINAEEAGEGWSDYLALMTTTNWTKSMLSDGAAKRPIGNFVIGQTPDGGGIRAFPYSTDMSINPWTYADMTATGGEVHIIGEIWCATVWDMTWNIIEQNGFIDGNLFNAASTGGNNIAMQLVMEGMKLQPCRPGFIDARNGILKADTLLYGGRYSAAIWKAFARRGMGLYASQGSSNSTADQVADFTEPTTTMPIAKTGLEAAKQHNTTFLTWNRSNFTSSSPLMVERSRDGIHFTTIGTAAGSSFTDVSPADGNNTYRLSQLEKSGKKVYTNLCSVEFNMVTITPNPAKDFIAVTVNGNTQPLTITLLGSNGQKISTYKMNGSFRQIHLPAVASGVYYVLITGDNVSYKNRIVVQ